MSTAVNSMVTCLCYDWHHCCCCRLAEAASKALAAPADKVYAMQQKAITTEFPPKIMLQKYRKVWPYTSAVTVLLLATPCHMELKCRWNGKVCPQPLVNVLGSRNGLSLHAICATPCRFAAQGRVREVSACLHASE